ncbi:hypothetical protein [Pseudomonas sp. R76]|uniref:hypothetical protein n=1 Tax=Pseudomonas sp. R76 TaxID=1573711 RepID=UPI00135BDBD6|nr:hypothetical protein [Pseudomonas sp. R76]
MAAKTPISPYPLRLRPHVKEAAKAQSELYRRSLNTEIEMLIEEGLKWREMQQSRQAVA